MLYCFLVLWDHGIWFRYSSSAAVKIEARGGRWQGLEMETNVLVQIWYRVFSFRVY